MVGLSGDGVGDRPLESRDPLTTVEVGAESKGVTRHPMVAIPPGAIA